MGDGRGGNVFTRHPLRWAIAAAMLATVALRLRFVWTPITADEGGYVAIGRAWFGGARLYRDVWIDRPQALLATFGLLDLFTGASPAMVRALAMCFALAGVLGAALIARALFPAQRWAAAGAAWFVALFSATATFEGFIANGELLGGGLATLAIGLAANARRWRHPCWVLFGAGLLAGLAVSMRQTSLDGMAVPVLIAVATPLLGLSWAARRRAVAVFALGAVTVVGAQIAHGLLTEPGGWWYGMYRFRAEERSVANAEWWRFWRTFGAARAVFWPSLVALAIAALVWRIRAGRGRWLHPGGAVAPSASTVTPARAWIVLAGWLALMTVGFVWGGQFYHHYWVILTFPLGVIVGVLLAAVRPRPLALVLGAFASLGPLVPTIALAARDRGAVMGRAHDDGRLLYNERLAQWFRSARQPGETLGVLCGSAAVYALIDQDPPFAYLWIAAVERAEDGVPSVVRALRGDRAPTYVAMMGSLRSCDPRGEIQAALDARYTAVATDAGIPILRLRPG